MKRTVLIVALLLTGCSKPANEVSVQNESKAGDAASVSALKARITALVDQCNRIAVEREILSAKYNALIEVYHPDMKPDKFAIERCSDADAPAGSRENERKAPQAEAGRATSRG